MYLWWDSWFFSPVFSFTTILLCARSLCQLCPQSMPVVPPIHSIEPFSISAIARTANRRHHELRREVWRQHASIYRCWWLACTSDCKCWTVPLYCVLTHPLYCVLTLTLPPIQLPMATNMFDMFGSSSVGGAMSTPISASCPAAMKEDGEGWGGGWLWEMRGVGRRSEG